MADYKKTADTDKSHIDAFKKSLAQAHRNAGQGELGRALGVSKVQDIKSEIEAVNKNLIAEGNDVQQFAEKMTRMHEPKKLDLTEVSAMELKGQDVMSQIASVN